MTKKKTKGLHFQLDDLPAHIQAQIKEKLPVTEKEKKPANNQQPVKKASPPHELLWSHLQDIEGLVCELENVIPGRKFRLDIAHPALKVAVEVDGWQYHGKYKDAHAKDRERQNLLVSDGWQILRFSAGQIFDNPEKCALQVMKLLWKQNIKT